MAQVKRLKNPILLPNKENDWEAQATFNGCVIRDRGKFHLVYRAISSPRSYLSQNMAISSIGYAISSDGIHFKNRRRLIKPEHEWEIFGCEDPRITKLNGKYFIFYTALSSYPLTPPGIKIGVAITRNFKEIKERHLVTFFNSKAMALFPKKINGKIVGILTVNTDLPPAKIGIAFFDREEQIWSQKYWENWLALLDANVISLQRTENDQVEVGAPPVETRHGWLLIYSYIKNYLSTPRTFGIEAVMLDFKNPLKIVGRTRKPFMVPQEDYELYGNVPNVIFPSGVIIENGKLFIYYGAADTTCCLAKCSLKSLLKEIF